MLPQTPWYLLQRSHNQKGIENQIENAIGPHEDLLKSVKRRKLKWYGHVTRPSGTAKIVLQGTVQGGRRRGRHRKWLEDNIREWAGFEWNILQRKVENSEEWRKLVAKSPVVPQQSARQRDRWEWRWMQLYNTTTAQVPDWVNIKVIQTWIKLQSLIMFSIMQSLKQIGPQVSRRRTILIICSK